MARLSGLHSRETGIISVVRAVMNPDSVCVITNLEVVRTTAVTTCTLRVGAVQPIKGQVVAR